MPMTFLNIDIDSCLFLPQQGYTHSVPNTLLAQTAQNARELEFQYSPFPVAQSMQSRNINNASSLSGQSISMPEVNNPFAFKKHEMSFVSTNFSWLFNLVGSSDVLLIITFVFSKSHLSVSKN